MKRKSFFFLLTVLLALCLCCFAACSYTGDGEDLKSELGIAVKGGNFPKGAQLAAERLNMSDERAQEALKLLPATYALSEETDMIIVDVSVLSRGEKIQPEGKVTVSVPAPLPGVKEYAVYHIKDGRAEWLFSSLEDGILTFETDSFSLFLIGDRNTGEKVTVKAEGPCEGQVTVEAQQLYGRYYQQYRLETGEEESLYLRKGQKIRLSATASDPYRFVGWYRQTGGVTEAEPFSTESETEITASGRATFVAKFAGDPRGAYQMWAFPGASNIPVGHSDGRASSVLYIKPGNEQKIDPGAVIMKGLKRTGKGLEYVAFSRDQYTITGLDGIDYSKEGRYRIDFRLKEDEELTHTIYLYISEENPTLRAKATVGGRFRVDDNRDEYFDDRIFATTNIMQKVTLTAEAFSEFTGAPGFSKYEFDGWYLYGDGGVIGEKLSEEPVYELRADMGDRTVIAVFRIKEHFSSLDGVKEISVLPGTSRIPAREDGNIVDLFCCKPGAAGIDLLKTEVRGRIVGKGGTERYVTLALGDYDIDFGGADFAAEGVYTVTFSARGIEKPVVLTLSVSEKHARVTAMPEANGTLIIDGDRENPITDRDEYVSGYFALDGTRKILAVADEDYKFVGWYTVDEEGNRSEEPISLSAEYEFVQNGEDLRLVALFEYNAVGVTLGRSAGGTVYRNGQKVSLPECDLAYIVQNAQKGSTLTLQAVPDEGYLFFGWASASGTDDADAVVSESATYVIEDVSEPIRLFALFVKRVTRLGVNAIPAGFDSDDTFYYSLADKAMPDLTKLEVYGYTETDMQGAGTRLGRAEYETDISAVERTKTGVYPVTITLKRDRDVTLTLYVDIPQAQTYAYVDRTSDGAIHGVIRKNGETVVSSPDGYYEAVALGGTLTLTAVADENYKFAGWYIAHDFSGTVRFYSENATETFTVTDNTYLYARFIEKGSVTFTAIAGEGGTVSEFAPSGSSPAMERLDLAAREGGTITVSAGASYSYTKFVGWYDGEGADARLLSTEEIYEVTVTENTVVYARFEKAFFLQISIEGGGEFTVEGASSENGLFYGDLPENSDVTVGVRALAGYRFVGWFVSSDVYDAEKLLSTEPTHTFTLSEESGNLHITALFRAEVSEVRLEDSSDYGFRLDPEGKLITDYLLTLNGEFYAMPDGQPLLGKTADGYVRLIYGVEYTVESTISYTMNGMFDTSKEGTFTITYTYLADPGKTAVITIRIAEFFHFLPALRPYDGGYFTENGERVDIANGRYAEKGTEITLTAVAEEFYEFVGWYTSADDQSETPISSDATCTFTVNGDLYVYAKFVRKETVLFRANGGEAGYITEDGERVDLTNGREVVKGSEITLTAHVSVEGYRFVGWYTFADDQSETLISSDATYTFTASEDMQVFAVFAGTESV